MWHDHHLPHLPGLPQRELKQIQIHQCSQQPTWKPPKSTSAECINKVWIVQKGTLFSLGRNEIVSGAAHRWSLKHCAARHKPGREQTLHNPTYLRYLGVDSNRKQYSGHWGWKGNAQLVLKGTVSTWKSQCLKTGAKPCTRTCAITKRHLKMVCGNVCTASILPQQIIDTQWTKKPTCKLQRSELTPKGKEKNKYFTT